MIFDALSSFECRLPCVATRGPGAEIEGVLTPRPKQVVENLEAQQGAGTQYTLG